MASSRRTVLLGAAALALGATNARGEESVEFPFPGGVGRRPLTNEFPQKGAMVLQRARPPLLETPFEVFDRGLYTPNDQFFVRWHWSGMPTRIDTAAYRLVVRGHVEREVSLSLAEILTMPRVEMAAVNQCSGNSRGYFLPRVPGAQWSNGAMGNARWTGVALRDVLDRAGVRAGAVQVRLRGLDTPPVPDAPDFMKSLAVDHARDGEVLIAFAMNGETLPLLNGFPLRLVVPGWFSTYWLKMLSDIEVLDTPDENFWMKAAYLIPDTPHADMQPGQSGVKFVPVSRMGPRSFVTNLRPGARIAAGAPAAVRGIAFGGDNGVARVDFSSDGGVSWQVAQLGADEGKYGFRRWESAFTPDAPGPLRLLVRCTSASGAVQSEAPIWNPSGFMRNLVERLPVEVT